MAEVALQARGLTRRFGDRVAVDNLDLTVLEGDVYGFLGPNGAGKTTAMRCMLGLIRRDAGDVSFFGDADLVRSRAVVGAIIETPAFHGWLSGLSNLKQAAVFAGLDGSEADAEIARVLERVGLVDRASDLAKTYSLGMKQRLAIARALLGRPRLMLLDEPTNGLDPRGMREMRDLIRSLALHDHITVFVSSHLLAEVQAICNRVGIIQEGKLRAEGTVAELLSSAGGARLQVGSSDPDALMRALNERQGVTVHGPGSHGQIAISLSELTVAELNAALVSSGVPVTSLVPDRRNLEDVFLEVTA